MFIVKYNGKNLQTKDENAVKGLVKGKEYVVSCTHKFAENNYSIDEIASLAPAKYFDIVKGYDINTIVEIVESLPYNVLLEAFERRHHQKPIKPARASPHILNTICDRIPHCILWEELQKRNSDLKSDKLQNLFVTTPGGIEWVGTNINLATMPENGKVKWYCPHCKEDHITLFTDIKQLSKGYGQGDFVINCARNSRELPDEDKQVGHDVYIDARRIPKPVLPILNKVAKKYSK